MKKYQSYGRTDIPYLYIVLSSIIFILQHHIKGLWLDKLRALLVKLIVRSLRNTRKREGLTEGKVIQVERRENLPEEEFVSQYLRPGVPVIFSGQAENWTCTKLWDMKFLQNRYGEKSFNVIETPGLSDDPDKMELTDRKILMKEFVQEMEVGVAKDYLRFCPLIESDKSLIEDLDKNWLDRMRKCFMGVSYQTFIGPAKKRTAIHSELMAFFSIMVDGEKNWTLYPTSAFPLINPVPAGKGYQFSKLDLRQVNPQTHPGVNLLHRFTCHLKKGDILFVPAWMWHEVENVTTSWGLSCQFTNTYGLVRQPFFTFTRIFLSKPSFLSVLYYSFFRTDITTRSKYLLTPKIRLKG